MFNNLNICWLDVESTSIAAIAWNKNELKLFIRFQSKGNPEWSYSPVTYEDYQLFIKAESLGSFFHTHIKTNPGIKAERL